ncbi:MAG: hypothetical protein WC679_01110 [Bacteroidales bacterium]|jgi:hypothetical protein
MKYRIITRNCALEMSNDVNTLLDKGWTLKDELKLCIDDKGEIKQYCQVLVYDEPIKKKKEPEYLVENIAPIFQNCFDKIQTYTDGIRCH